MGLFVVFFIFLLDFVRFVFFVLHLEGIADWLFCKE